jgi:plasmid maintenance system antidote protein VapI
MNSRADYAMLHGKFLDAIDSHMRTTGVSRSELARRLGCSPANITYMFNQRRNITMVTMAQLAEALELEVQVVVAPKGEKE